MQLLIFNQCINKSILILLCLNYEVLVAYNCVLFFTRQFQFMLIESRVLNNCEKINSLRGHIEGVYNYKIKTHID